MRTLPTHPILTALCAILLSSCAHGPPADAGAAKAARASGQQSLPALLQTQRYPLSIAQRPTTSAGVFLGNLDGQIAELERRQQNGGAAGKAALAAALQLRFRILGRLVDNERALALADQAGDSSRALLTRAAGQLGLHEFASAQATLAKLERWPEASKEALVLRRDLQMALGDYDALRLDFAQSDQPVGDFFELTHRADLRLMLGDLAGATLWYRAAQDLYNDVSPFPLAWLYTQQGIAHLRYRDFQSAKPFFEAAVARLPDYYLAAEHLAECEMELGELEQARTRYQAVIAQTGNPEFYAALADLERRDGKQGASANALAKANSGYAALLARYPSAYAQHAAQFYLETDQPALALALAQQNRALRQDVGSFILLARAEQANRNGAKACTAARAAKATGLNPPELDEIAGLLKACGAG